MKKIRLNRDCKNQKKIFYALVDDEDYEEINKYKWTILNSPSWNKVNPTNRYAYRRFMKDGKYKNITMHRQITGYLITDHIDRNGLNNQRKNLRPATHQQNMHNIGLRRNNTSGYTGVHKHNNGYRAQMRINGKWKYIGFSLDKLKCAKMMAEAIKKYRGDFGVVQKVRRK